MNKKTVKAVRGSIKDKNVKKPSSIGRSTAEKLVITKKSGAIKKGKIPKEYPFKQAEKKWSEYWVRKKIYEPDITKAKNPFYNLMMFPYPSAEGLHVGNMYAFTGSDIYGRFMRSQGYDVLEPIGLDGFGIHSENYAMKKGVHPMRQAKVAEKNFYKQLHMVGNGFSWDHHVETYDPEYYKWTQWLFRAMFENGLVYRKKAPVNWCPSCKTVLADEQVIAGKCERCDSEVSKKELEQWFFKITKYAPKLLKNIDKIDWSERVKIAQKNWIGRSEGALISFEMVGGGLSAPVKADVFTTRPDTLMGVTFVVVAPESATLIAVKDGITNWPEVEEYIWKAKNKPEAERMADDKDKTGVELKGVKAVNPANGMEVPVWVSDYVVSGYGTGVVMGVPAYDERDLAFAQAFGLSVIQAPLVPKEKIVKAVSGKMTTQYRLRDWLISRQRYWGPPIPLIYCEHCAEKVKAAKGKEKQKYSAGEIQNPGWSAVKEKDLPVMLPFVKNFKPAGTGDSPLSSVPSFYNTKCPKCGNKARRETDVSDTFLDSSWYFLRYPSVGNKKAAFDKKTTKKWLPVDMYLGGAEHSVLHLLYSRFVTMALKDMGYIDFDEPFTKFRAHGLIIRDGKKMSKSKGNVVNPDEYIKKFGADALRLHLMFIGPLEEGGDFRDAGMVGITRFLNRVWSFSTAYSGKGKTISSWMHKGIKKITEDIALLKYNTAIAELMVILNGFTEKPEEVTKKDLETFLILLSPFAPFMTEELWSIIGNKASIHKQAWPIFDKKALKQESFDLVVQVNGRMRATLKAKKGTTEAEALEMAKGDERVRNHIGSAEIRRVIFVENRIINIIV
ncbi:MAG: class I tRNA ligase family protein [Candidatus Colwellbacteria bacterium]|nr:class I tRNA ligase family protein [Candidatus Colwellbacteria bacterium]